MPLERLLFEAMRDCEPGLGAANPTEEEAAMFDSYDYLGGPEDWEDEDLDCQDETIWLQEEKDDDEELEDQDSPEETSWSHEEEKKDEEFDGVTIAGMPIPMIIDFFTGRWPPG